MQACEVPGAPSKPVQVQTDATSIVVSWSEPGDNGGCPVLGYVVYIDDGQAGEFKEANAV